MFPFKPLIRRAIIFGLSLVSSLSGAGSARSYFRRRLTRKDGAAATSRQTPTPQGKPLAITSRAKPKEIIGLDWMMANLERRYRSNAAGKAETEKNPPHAPLSGSPQAEGNGEDRLAADMAWIQKNLEQRFLKRKASRFDLDDEKNKAPKSVIDAGEIHQRLLKIHRGKIPGDTRRNPPPPAPRPISQRLEARAPGVATPSPPMAPPAPPPAVSRDTGFALPSQDAAECKAPGLPVAPPFAPASAQPLEAAPRGNEPVEPVDDIPETPDDKTMGSMCRPALPDERMPAPPPVLADDADAPDNPARFIGRPAAPEPGPSPSPPSRTSLAWSGYAPPLDLLEPPAASHVAIDPDTLALQGRLIEEKLAEFKVNVAVRDAAAGPVITRYEVEPAVGVRGAQVVNLMKDLARALSVTSIRVVETIPGKTTMGLELPNPRRETIRLSEVLSSTAFRHHGSKLAMALGKDITGQPVVADLARAPHMLVAGTTGSGKSVGVNAMILSLLYRATPDEVRFVMIDPKMLELSVYNDIPHLLAPVVTDMKLAANALNWCVAEMERRYRLMSALGVRNLAGFNQKVAMARDAGQPLWDPFPLVPESPTPLETLPFIVVVVDEFADLMMVAGKKIEELIARLAQKARAAGIHLVLATQRPSVDVITGLIKANIPTRIAFQVSSKVDSRTILDQMGAETLLGQGDMLYLPPGTGYPQRVHGAFVADEEVHAIVEHIKRHGPPDYVEGVLGSAAAEGEQLELEEMDAEADPLYDQAVAIVIETRRASISLIQRHLRIGYNRAARLVEQMEFAGIVSPMESNGNRKVILPEA